MVAIVDANTVRRDVMLTMMRPYYRVLGLASGDQALEELTLRMPHAVVIAEAVPPVGGYELVRRLRDNPATRDMPVVLLVGRADRTAEEGLKWCGGNRLLIWPCHASAALKAVSSMCSLHVQRRWEALSPEPRKALNDTLSAFNALSESVANGGGVDLTRVNDACSTLVTALENNHVQEILEAVREHDDYTFVHCFRVSTFLAMFAHVTGMSRAEKHLLAAGGLLHDVGKVKVPYEVLNHPCQLSVDQRGLIEKHVGWTVEQLREVPGIHPAIVTICAQHHEKLDGSGYPLGLSGGRLDELARMAAIVDVFGALTDRRVYKAAMDVEAALNLMVEEMQGKLDMPLVAVFRQAMLDAAALTR